MQHGTLSVTFRTQNFVSSPSWMTSAPHSNLRFWKLCSPSWQFNNVCWMLYVYVWYTPASWNAAHTHTHTDSHTAVSGSYISNFMFCLHLFQSSSAPSLNKCTVSHEGVHKSLLHFICSEETGSVRHLNSSCMGSFALALGGTDSHADSKGRNRWCDSTSVSQSGSHTDRLTDICYCSTEKSFFFQQSQRCCDGSQLGCLIQPYLLPPSGPKTPCGRWRSDSAATRTIEKWCWRWRWEPLIFHVKLLLSSISVVRQKRLWPWLFLSWVLK